MLATLTGVEFDLRGELVEDGDVNDCGQGVVVGHYFQDLTITLSNGTATYDLDNEEVAEEFAARYGFGSEPSEADLLRHLLATYLLNHGAPEEAVFDYSED